MTSSLREDREAIAEVVNLYYHLVDGPDLARLGEVFSHDCVFDTSAFGVAVWRGIEDIIDGLGGDGPRMVLAHIGANPLIEVDRDEAHCVTKCIGLLDGGTIGVAIHSDRLRRTEAGWRVYERIVTLPPHLKAAFIQ